MAEKKIAADKKAEEAVKKMYSMWQCRKRDSIYNVTSSTGKELYITGINNIQCNI